MGPFSSSRTMARHHGKAERAGRSPAAPHTQAVESQLPFCPAPGDPARSSLFRVTSSPPPPAAHADCARSMAIRVHCEASSGLPPSVRLSRRLTMRWQSFVFATPSASCPRMACSPAKVRVVLFGFQENTARLPIASAAISRSAAWLTETSRRFGNVLKIASHSPSPGRRASKRAVRCTPARAPVP